MSQEESSLERSEPSHVQRVLLIDDQDLQLRSWKREMARRRLQFSAASNRAQASKAAQEQKHQLAIVDLFLGPENGLSIVESLRAIDPSLTIVLVSADLTVRFAVEAMRKGADWACNKPVEWDTAIGIANGLPPPPPELDRHALDYDSNLKAVLEAALQAEWGNQTRAAKRLRMQVTSFRRRCIKYGIKLPWKPR